MIKRISALALSFALLGGTMPVRADDELNTGKIKHVLLISVDGLHALDPSATMSPHIPTRRWRHSATTASPIRTPPPPSPPILSRAWRLS